MTKTNDKNVLEHLLDNKKNRILASRYQNTIYQGKTLCEYFGVESKTQKVGGSLHELIDEMIVELPALDCKHFFQYRKIYAKYPRLCLRVWTQLYPISRLLKHFDAYKDKEWMPIMTRGIRWYTGHCKLTYINMKNLSETKEAVFHQSNVDVKIVHNLLEPKRDEYLMKTMWSDYEAFRADW